MKKLTILIVLFIMATAITAFADTGPPVYKSAEPAEFVYLVYKNFDANAVPILAMLDSNNVGSIGSATLNYCANKSDDLETIGMNKCNGGVASLASTRSKYATRSQRLHVSRPAYRQELV